jgi:hypothetical protein
LFRVFARRLDLGGEQRQLMTAALAHDREWPGVFEQLER